MMTMVTESAELLDVPVRKHGAQIVHFYDELCNVCSYWVLDRAHYEIEGNGYISIVSCCEVTPLASKYGNRAVVSSINN